jgi:hypothetical protein
MAMEPAIAVAAVFGARPWIEKLPRSVMAALAFVALSLAGEQVVRHRRLAKDVQFPADVTKTVEYRVAQRMAHDSAGARVMLPGSIGRWANAFAEIQQVSGGPLSSDVRVPVAWLKAYGAAAVVTPRRGQYDGVLPELWTEDEATAYRVPLPKPSLARVVPESALVARPADTPGLERYAAALDDQALPEASFEWQGRNAIFVSAVTAPGQVISIAVSHHPGWRAHVNGRPAPLRRDGLGLMWLRPGVAGACTVEMRYDGGWELRLCRWLSLATLAAGFVFLVRGARR